jgi:hypothetical protein
MRDEIYGDVDADDAIICTKLYKSPKIAKLVAKCMGDRHGKFAAPRVTGSTLSWISYGDSCKHSLAACAGSQVGYLNRKRRRK